MTLNGNPTIPESEYPERWAKVQAMMARHNLDLLIAYADDRAVFGHAHARWLANFPVHFEPCFILFPPSGAPVMVCGPETVNYALLASTIKDIRALDVFTHPDEDYPYSKIQSLPEILHDIGYNAGDMRRIGLAGKGLIGADLYTALTRTFAGAEWVDSESAMLEIRAIKSPAEIAVIRHTYNIAEIGLQAAVEAIRPGVTERAVAAEVDAAMRRAGIEGYGLETCVAAGPNSRSILGRSTWRKIEDNDLVLLTIFPRYEGYHAAIGRPVLVGNPGKEIEFALEKAWEAELAAFELMRPGAPGREVEGAARRTMEEAGLGEYFPYSGVHSVGVIEFEPPIFGPSATGTVQAEMVLSIDVPVFHTPWGGLRHEDGFLITADGAERLHETPYRIQK
ncbi:MAG: Xaa-Pro peptidase family protein [bacterium]|nr:Xaa-Pro peptidase family protein [bacterium]